MRGKGINNDRIKPGSSDFREIAFVEEWQKNPERLELLFRKACAENDPSKDGEARGLGYAFKYPIGPPTERDHIVAETIIQWLGSNVGMSFVDETLKAVGGQLIYPPRPKEHG